ncbi:MAG: hypothetical protein MUC56_00340 [Thermoanaerobaculales bacterium]|jgi:outer membrane lipoprotein-sorting protein|nr:hypothetical protein [Thermoanaerobaculales bacterium]
MKTTPALSFLGRPLLLLLLVSACAAPPSPVDEIVASNLAARGGEAKIRALTAIRESGVATASGGRVARVVREMKRPGLYRLEFSFQGTTSVFAHDGTTSWRVAPLEGVLEPTASAAVGEVPATIDQLDLEGPLVGWREKGHTVELVGRETLPGGEAFKLAITLADGSLRYDFVDAESRQVVRSDVTRSIRGRPVRLENHFSDFREVGGLVFPHVVETRAAERPGVLRIAIERIELDPDLDDARFAMPAP